MLWVERKYKNKEVIFWKKGELFIAFIHYFC
jgi:hypothetical protein